MKEYPSREQAWSLLKKYNKEPFHLQHAVTLEKVMAWFTKELGYEEDVLFWSSSGPLSACSMMLILSSGLRNIAKKHRSCCKKSAAPRPSFMPSAATATDFAPMLSPLSRWKRFSLRQMN